MKNFQKYKDLKRYKLIVSGLKPEDIATLNITKNIELQAPCDGCNNKKGFLTYRFEDFDLTNESETIARFCCRECFNNWTNYNYTEGADK